MAAEDALSTCSVARTLNDVRPADRDGRERRSRTAAAKARAKRVLVSCLTFLDERDADQALTGLDRNTEFHRACAATSATASCSTRIAECDQFLPFAIDGDFNFIGVARRSSDIERDLIFSI